MSALNDVLSWRCVQNNKKNWLTPIMANSFLHEQAKFRICYLLKGIGVEFWTEAVFKNGSGRADIYLPDRNLAIEILDTETMERFEKKKNTWPCRVIGVFSQDHIDVARLEKLIN